MAFPSATQVAAVYESGALTPQRKTPIRLQAGGAFAFLHLLNHTSIVHYCWHDASITLQ